jgi:ADP-L-glycero-D-manno-heptose 6-epimerase
MIIVTGGAGFIGSNLIKKLNKNSYKNIYIFDNITKLKKNNLQNLNYKKTYNKSEIFNFLKKNEYKIDCIFHLGACTNTQETNWDYLYKNNFIYSKKLIEFSARKNIKLIYASSASIYGKKTGNFNEIKQLNSFKPLNYYAKSKLILDKFLFENIKKKIPIISLRYFNVYGKNECHKLEMASPIYSFFQQIKKNGTCKIFGNFDGYKKGEHSRDFVYVKDCTSINLWAMKIKNCYPKILNVGSGDTNNFNFVAETIINYLNYGKIEYIKFPNKLKKGYQSKTKANIKSLRNLGYKNFFFPLRDGIKDFINE